MMNTPNDQGNATVVFGHRRPRKEKEKDMEIEQALKWADTCGPIPSHPPNGDAQALMALAAEVRKLREERDALRH